MPYCRSCGQKDPVVADHRCQSCGALQADGPRPCAGVLIENAQGQVLLAKRAHEPYAGQWDIVGGFMEAGESAEDAARREVLEETGLHVDGLRFHGAWLDDYVPGVKTLNFIYVATVSRVEGLQAQDDVAELRWFSRQEPVPRIAFAHGQKAVENWWAQAAS